MIRKRPTNGTLPPGGTGSIDQFIPQWDIRDRHEIVVRAPAEVAFDVAWNADLEAHPLSRAIFGLREKVFRTKAEAPRRSGIVATTAAIGWGVLAHRPGRELVMGAVTQPWKANVRFRSIDRKEFLDFAEPGLVKIVFTLEAEPLGSNLTRFRTETRAIATDRRSRRKFRWYWMLVAPGVKSIRWVMLSVVKREAERHCAELEERRRVEPVWRKVPRTDRASFGRTAYRSAFGGRRRHR